MTERPNHSHHDIPDEASRLFDEAVSRYGASALWNMRPAKTVGGVKSLARALEKRGDLAASGLARELRMSVTNAA
jgi:ABC-type branched-subunit amino acid transport system substrate-binding protein